VILREGRLLEGGVNPPLPTIKPRKTQGRGERVKERGTTRLCLSLRVEVATMIQKNKGDNTITGYLSGLVREDERRNNPSVLNILL
jgi:hypothetical protein